MELNELKAVIEALIFVAEEPITDRQILAVLEESQVTKEDITTCISAIKENTNSDVSRGLQLVEVAGGYQFRTKESCVSWIQKLNIPKPVRISQPALETLSIIAYRQPLVRAEIEALRGVDVGGVLKTLLERNLIRIIGRRDEPGQPLIYGTTAEFLELFGLNSLSELPALSDIEDLARRQVETETPSPLSLVKNDDEEEQTEVIEDMEDDEEETEIVKKKNDEGDEVLDKVDKGLKELRKLEKEIFPKKNEEESTQDDQTISLPEEGSAPSEADAPAEDDRPGD